MLNQWKMVQSFNKSEFVIKIWKKYHYFWESFIYLYQIHADLKGKHDP